MLISMATSTTTINDKTNDDRDFSDIVKLFLIIIKQNWNVQNISFNFNNYNNHNFNLSY